MERTQIPILSGIYSDAGPDVRIAYPRNLVPVATDSGISKGYLRPADGLVFKGTGPGLTRAGINWLGVCFRVMGDQLVTVDVSGTVTSLGTVGEPGNLSPATLVYGPDRLAIACDGKLFYYSASLGLVEAPVVLPAGLVVFVVDVVWIDGYFMVTNGSVLVVSDLNDPFSFTKFGTSEADPDPIVALLRLRNEVWALNRNTIEAFDDVGGNGFPFQRIEGAQIQKGCVGTRACCVFLEAIAFLGSGQNEAPGIYVGANANATKLSTIEIDRVLQGYTETQLQTVVLETRNDSGALHLYVHLPDQTRVYDHAASEALGQPVWFTLTSTLVRLGQYRAIHFVYCYDRWLCGDPTSFKVGEMSQTTGSHWDVVVGWDFSTGIAYNKGAGLVFGQLELVALTGRIAVGTTPTIATSYSLDMGVTFSPTRTINAGLVGDRLKPLVWLAPGAMRRYRIQRFQGTSDAHISFCRLEATAEALAF